MTEQVYNEPGKEGEKAASNFAFSYEGIFKLGENLGSLAGVSLVGAISIILPFTNGILSLAFYFLLAGLGLYAIYTTFKILRVIFDLKIRPTRNTMLEKQTWNLLVTLKIASIVTGLLGTVLIMIGVLYATQGLDIYEYAFLQGFTAIQVAPSLYIADVLIYPGIILALASTSLELAIYILVNRYLKSTNVQKSIKLADMSVVIDIAVVTIASSMLGPALMGDFDSAVILSIVAYFVGILPPNFMGSALKIYYYHIMTEHTSKVFKKTENILQIEDLKTWFPIRGGVLSTNIGHVKAVDGVSLSIRRGETMGLVGESGCGKTTLGRTILGLANRQGGSIFFNGEVIPIKFPPYLRRYIQFIFQDPDASLNPRMNIFEILAEPLRNLNPEMSRNQIRNRVLELIDLVSMNYEHLYRFPHEFSGGQKQRIVIARALACNPEFIVLDEPTSSLDVSVQAQILNLLIDLQKRLNLSYLFITHNLSVVQHIASRVAVMYLGKLVELGPVKKIFENPRHPYTRALLSARSIPDPEKARHRIILKGDVPSPVNPPSGCPFNPRCFYELKSARCKFEPPKMVELEPDHFIWTSMEGEQSCWKSHEAAVTENHDE